MIKKILSFLIILCFSQTFTTAQEEFRVLRQIEGPVNTNCYLFYGLTSGEAALFDAAGRLDSLTSYITHNNLKLKYIFITHAHWDHVEGIFELKERFPEAKICLSQEECMAMQNYTRFARESDPEKFEKITRDSSILKMISIDLSSIKPDIFVKDGEEFKLGDIFIKAILAPGHSAGSMCYYCGGILFSGDVLFYRLVGNTDFYRASRTDLIESVRRLYRELPESTIVYPGHDEATDILSEKTQNKYITIDGGKWGSSKSPGN